MNRVPQTFKLEWPKFEFIVASSRYVVTLRFMIHTALSAVPIASITEALNIYSLSPVSCNVTAFFQDTDTLHYVYTTII